MNTVRGLYFDAYQALFSLWAKLTVLHADTSAGQVHDMLDQVKAWHNQAAAVINYRLAKKLEEESYGH